MPSFETETPPLASPSSHVVTTKVESPLPPITPGNNPPQNAEYFRPNPSTDSGKWLKILLIVAGVVILGLIAFFVVTSLMKSERPNTPEKTETSTTTQPLPTTATPSKTQKGEIQTEGGGDVNMRDQPTEDGAVVLPIPTGAEVVILRYGNETELKNGETGRWCRVSYRAQLGWVWGKYVKEKN